LTRIAPAPPFFRLAEAAYDEVTKSLTGEQRGAKIVNEARLALRRPHRPRA